MALNICRMCRSTKTNLSLTIFDEVIAKFLDLVPSIVRNSLLIFDDILHDLF